MGQSTFRLLASVRFPAFVVSAALTRLFGLQKKTPATGRINATAADANLNESARRPSFMSIFSTIPSPTRHQWNATYADCELCYVEQVAGDLRARRRSIAGQQIGPEKRGCQPK